MSDVLDRNTKDLRRSVNTPDFPSASYVINPVFVPDEATILAVPARHRKINQDDTVSEMTTAEKAVVDDDPTALADHKEVRYAEIALKTEQLIENDTFTHAAKTFNLDTISRETWAGLEQAAGAGLVAFPQVIGASDNDTHSITNAADLKNFYGAGFAVVKAHKESGRDLKKQIFDAATRAVVDAIVDTRT